MSKENKTVFRMIREKAAALLAGAGLAYPPGPTAPVAVADLLPAPTTPANA